MDLARCWPVRAAGDECLLQSNLEFPVHVPNGRGLADQGPRDHLSVGTSRSGGQRTLGDPESRMIFDLAAFVSIGQSYGAKILRRDIREPHVRRAREAEP